MEHDLPEAQFNTLRNLLPHSGITGRRELNRLDRTRQLLLDGAPVDLDSHCGEGTVFSVSGRDYRVIAGGGRGRLQIVAVAPPVKRIGGSVRVHAGFHKCLTKYCKKIYKFSSRPPFQWGGSFRHFFHRLDAFYAECDRHTINSVSGNAIDLGAFEDIRVVRFIRDPRDMLVSAYFYHKRSAEHWCDLIDPTDVDWKMVNGAVPAALPPNSSLAGYLNQVSLEEGLLAEIDFRRHHFESMLAWPESDAAVRLFRYEDILGNEVEVFREIFDFFGMSGLSRWIGVMVASRTRASKMVEKNRHIRNPNSGQWRKYFTDRVADSFRERYGEVLDRYGYPRH